MATKLGRILTYFGWLPSIKLLDSLTRWSCKISWPTKTIKSQLPQCLWPPNLPGWRLTSSGSYNIVPWSLIRRSYLDQAIVWKMYISIFTRLMSTKFGRVLTTGRRFSMQTRKASSTSRSFCSSQHCFWTCGELVIQLVLIIIIIIIIVIIIIIIIIISIIIIIIMDYYTQSIVVSCSSWFCESGQKPVAKGLTESFTMILIMMLFLASKYHSQNPCCPQ